MIFFTDLDDTLLNRKKELTPLNRSALERCLEKGVAMVVTTGRALPSALRQAHRLGLDGESCYVISYNGAVVYDCSQKKVIYQKGLDLEVVRQVFDAAHAYGIHVQTYDNEGVVAEKDFDIMQRYCAIQSLPCKVVEDFRQLVKENPPKVLGLDEDPERVLDFKAKMIPVLKGKADLFLSNPQLVEIVPVGVNKGNAVRFLCDYLGLPIESSVAAGDAENDITMLEAAHVGCCMVNGDESVKPHADYVTERDCDHDGVAEILEKFILSKC